MTFDVAAIASMAGLADTRGNVPLGACIPRRTARDLPHATISRHEIRVLVHLDGETTLAQIADETSMPLTEVVGVFLGLLSQGLIEVPDSSPPLSQVVARGDHVE